MREKAAACLESTIWRPRNVHNHGTSSKRLLHSAFWSPGLTYYDLLPLAGGFHEHGCAPAVTSTTHDRSSSNHHIAPLLDFLYPAKTLAFLSRVVHSPSHAPRRRVVLGSRHLASLPRTSHTQDIRIAQIRPYSVQFPIDALAFHPDEYPKDGFNTGRNTTFRPPLQKEHGQDEMADLAHESGRTALDALTETLASPDAPYADKLVTRVHSQWASLSDQQREDIGLQKALFFWLADRQSLSVAQEVASWSQQIWDGFSSQDRDSRLFKAAVYQAVHRRRMGPATFLLKAARHARLKGDFGASILMQRYLLDGKWEDAFTLATEMHQYATALGDDLTYLKTFEGTEGGWLESRMSELFTWIDKRGHRSSLSRRQEFFARIISRFPVWIADPKHKERPQIRQRLHALEKLMNRMKRAKWAAIAYEPLMLETTRCSSKTKYLREDFTRVLARLWNDSLAIGESPPSKHLMTQILYAWEREVILWRNFRFRGTEPKLFPDDLHRVWEKHYPRLDYAARAMLCVLAVREGKAEYVERLTRDLYKTDGDDFPVKFCWFWIAVNARRRDQKAAQKAFDTICTDFKVSPDQRTWDMLLHAYFRADDLPGALDCFQRRLESGTHLTPHAITSLLNLYARRGDVAAVEELVQYAGTLGITIDVHIANTVIRAHAKSGNYSKAVEIFEGYVKQNALKTIPGNITMLYNSILMMHADRKDFTSTLEVHQRMKEEKIPLDKDSYAAMMLALCKRRRPGLARRLFEGVMQKDGVRPNAYHYATVMTGYLRVGQYHLTLKLWDHMKRAGVKPTLGNTAAYLKAKALEEHKPYNPSGTTMSEPIDEDPRPLENTIKELLAALDRGVEFNEHGEFGMSHLTPTEAKAALFESIIYIHGERRCFDAAWQLFSHASRLMTNDGSSTPPLRLVAAMMTVYSNSRQHEEVVRCWNLVVETARRLRTVILPVFPTASAPRISDPFAELTDSASSSDPFALPTSSAPISDRVAESTDSDSQTSAHLDAINQIKRPLTTLELRVSDKPAPAGRFLLSSAFSELARSLSNRKDVYVDAASVNSLLGTLVSLLRQTYQLNNAAWNSVVESLLRLKPPRVLLAYTLTERFLTPGFPGWIYPDKIVANEKGLPNLSRRAEGMNYIDYKQRFVPPDDLLPLYRTLVFLTQGLMELHTRENTGWGDDLSQDMRGELKAQVGTPEAVRRLAPKTVEIVRDMPVVYDELQRSVLRGQETFGKWNSVQERG